MKSRKQRAEEFAAIAEMHTEAIAAAQQAIRQNESDVRKILEENR